MGLVFSAIVSCLGLVELLAFFARLRPSNVAAPTDADDVNLKTVYGDLRRERARLRDAIDALESKKSPVDDIAKEEEPEEADGPEFKVLAIESTVIGGRLDFNSDDEDEDDEDFVVSSSSSEGECYVRARRRSDFAKASAYLPEIIVTDEGRYVDQKCDGNRRRKKRRRGKSKSRSRSRSREPEPRRVVVAAAAAEGVRRVDENLRVPKRERRSASETRTIATPMDLDRSASCGDVRDRQDLSGSATGERKTLRDDDDDEGYRLSTVEDRAQKSMEGEDGPPSRGPICDVAVDVVDDTAKWSELLLLNGTEERPRRKEATVEEASLQPDDARSSAAEEEVLVDGYRESDKSHVEETLCFATDSLVTEVEASKTTRQELDLKVVEERLEAGRRFEIRDVAAEEFSAVTAANGDDEEDEEESTIVAKDVAEPSTSKCDEPFWVKSESQARVLGL